MSPVFRRQELPELHWVWPWCNFSHCPVAQHARNQHQDHWGARGWLLSTPPPLPEPAQLCLRSPCPAGRGVSRCAHRWRRQTPPRWALGLHWNLSVPGCTGLNCVQKVFIREHLLLCEICKIALLLPRKDFAQIRLCTGSQKDVFCSEWNGLIFLRDLIYQLRIPKVCPLTDKW